MVCKLARDLTVELGLPYESQNPEKITNLMKDLVARETDFPTMAKQKILCYHLMNLIREIKKADGDYDMNAFVAAMSPFPKVSVVSAESTADDVAPLAANCEGDLAFNPLAPSMGQLDGTLESKLGFVKRIIVKDVLSHLIDDGEPSAGIVQDFAATMVQTFEDALATYDEELPQDLPMILDVCRALSALLNPSDTSDEAHEAVTDLVGAHLKPDADKSLIGTVSLCLQGNTHYKTMCDEVVSKGGSSKVYFPKLRSLKAQVNNIDFTAQDNIEQVDSLLKEMRVVRVNLRQGATYPLECQIQEKLEMVGRAMKEKHSTTPAETDISHLANFVKVLTMALEQWPQAQGLNELRKWGTAATDDHSKASKSSTIMDAVRSSYKNGGRYICRDNLAALVDVLTKHEGFVLSGKDIVKEVEDFILATVLDLQKDLQASDVPVQAMNLALKALPKDSPRLGEITKDVRLVELGGVAHKKYTEYIAAGATVQEQVAADGDGEKIKGVIRSMMAVREYVEHHKMAEALEKRPGSLSALDTGTKTLFETVHAFCSKTITGALKRLVEEARPVAGGSTGGKDWDADIAADEPLDAVLDLAKKTLTMKKAAWYKDQSAAISMKLKAWSELDNVFSMEFVDHDLKRSATDIINRLNKSFIEGLLCYLFVSEKDRNALKSKCHGIKKTAGSMETPVPWTNVQPQLYERAERAIKLR